MHSSPHPHQLPPSFFAGIYWTVRHFKKELFFFNLLLHGGKDRTGWGGKRFLFHNPYLMSVVAIPTALFHLNLPGRKTILPVWRRSSCKNPALPLTPSPLWFSHRDLAGVSPRPTAKFRGTLPPRGAPIISRLAAHLQNRDTQLSHFSSAPGWRQAPSTSSGLSTEICSLSKHVQKRTWPSSVDLETPWLLPSDTERENRLNCLAEGRRREESEISNLKNFLNNHLI